MKTIELTQGKKSFINDESYRFASKHKWCFDSSTGYAVSRVNGKKISLHRFVILAPENMHVDHINNDKLDNRLSNLRLCSQSGNNRNIGIRKNNTSGFKGVVFVKNIRKWRAQISLNKKCIFLGEFKEKVEAAMAYNKAAKHYHGEYAYLNKL